MKMLQRFEVDKNGMCKVYRYFDLRLTFSAYAFLFSSLSWASVFLSASDFFSFLKRVTTLELTNQKLNPIISLENQTPLDAFELVTSFIYPSRALSCFFITDFGCF